MCRFWVATAYAPGTLLASGAHASRPPEPSLTAAMWCRIGAVLDLTAFRVPTWSKWPPRNSVPSRLCTAHELTDPSVAALKDEMASPLPVVTAARFGETNVARG